MSWESNVRDLQEITKNELSAWDVWTCIAEDDGGIFNSRSDVLYSQTCYDITFATYTTPSNHTFANDTTERLG